MKKWIIAVTVLAVPLLTYACGPRATPTPTPDVQATVDARVAQIATETAIAQAQADLAVERTAVAATQTAVAQAQADLAVEQTAVAATQTAIAQAQADLVAEQTAVAATQTAVAATQMAMAVVTDTTRTPSDDVPSPPATVTPDGDGVSCPFYVYDARGSDRNHYAPEGWMGDSTDIGFDVNFQRDPDPARPSVIQITYTPRGTEQWAGIYWWDPPGANWGNIDGGFNLSCATKLTFWARGEHGGEKAEFKVGGLEGTYQDSLQPAPSTGSIVLTNEWVQYTLDLSGGDLSHIIGGFVWVTNRNSNPDGATIYLDDIRFE